MNEMRKRTRAKAESITNTDDQVARPGGDIGGLARGLAYFGRASEHDHRLALERERPRA